jgi:site-specific recombinase XerD
LYLAETTKHAIDGALSPRTAEAYAADLADLVQIIGSGTIADEVTTADIDAAITTFATTPDRRRKNPVLGAARSAASITRFRRSVSGFFSRAQTVGWVEHSPIDALHRRHAVPGPSNPARHALTLPQALALLDHGPGNPQPRSKTNPAGNPDFHRDRLALQLLVTFGVRASELCDARIGDLQDQEDDAGRFATWTIAGKGGKIRWLQLPAAVLEIRDQYLRTRSQRLSGDRLVVTRNGNPMTARDLERLLDRCEKRVLAVDPAHYRRVVPHGLRHTAATIAVSENIPLPQIQHMLGHSSLATTGIYTDKHDQELLAAMREHPTVLRPPTKSAGGGAMADAVDEDENLR